MTLFMLHSPGLPPPRGGGAKKLHAGNLQKLEMLTSSTEAWMNKLHSTI